MPTRNPTLEDIQLPNVGGPRPVAGIDPSGYGRGAEALARSGQILGKDIQSAAQDINEVTTYQQRNSALLAQDQALGDAVQLRQKYQPGGEKYTSDPQLLTQNYQNDLNDIIEKRLSGLPPIMREHATARIQIPFSRELASVGNEARTRQISSWRAAVVDEADEIQNTTGATEDPLHTARWQSWGTKVKLGVEQGYLTPVEGEALMRKTSRGVIDGEIRAKLKAGRDSAMQMLLDLERAQVGAGIAPTPGGPIVNVATRYGIDPSDFVRMERIESLGNPNARTGSYKGVMQLSQEEFDRYKPRPDASIWNAQDNMEAAAAKMKVEGDQFAAMTGRRPSGLDQYLIHNQGLGGYTAQLRNPNAPAWQNMYSTLEGRRKGEAWAKEAIWGNIPDQYKASFGNVNNVTGKEFIGVWSNKWNRMGGAAENPEGSPMPQTGGDPVKNILTPTHRDALIKEGRAILRAYDTDDDRALKEQEKLRKQKSLEVEDEYLKDAYSANPQKGTVDVVTDPRLESDPETKKKIIALYERANKPDPIGPISQQTTRQLFDRMALSDGDSNKITDLGPINQAFSEGNLTRADHDWLSTQFREAQTKDGEKLSKRKEEFLNGVKPLIDHTDDILGMKDTHGQQRLYQLRWDLDHLIEQDRHDKKNPWNRLDPNKPEYMGTPEALKPYVATSEDVMKRWKTMSGDSPEAKKPGEPLGPPFDPAKVTSVTELQAAYQRGQISRDEAQRIALERGWAARRPPMPPVPPVVPMSR